VSSEEYNSVLQFGEDCYILLIKMTQRLTMYKRSMPSIRRPRPLIRAVGTNAVINSKNEIMKRFAILILVFITCLISYGQMKVNPNGKYFNYNGTKIYYEDTGEGEPLLLLHKFFGTADNWKPYVETSSKQFGTIAVDMMGHGRSDIYNENDLNLNRLIC
jgi:hypothetical protein